MIDKSGRFWKGASHEDLREYLPLVTTDDEEKVTDLARAVCTCGGAVFSIRRVLENSVERKCLKCKKTHLIADSEKRFETSRPRPLKCSCGGKAYDIVVAFAIPSSIHGNAIWVGTRCVACAQLSTAGQWRIEGMSKDELLKSV